MDPVRRRKSTLLLRSKTSPSSSVRGFRAFPDTRDSVAPAVTGSQERVVTPATQELGQADFRASRVRVKAASLVSPEMEDRVIQDSLAPPATLVFQAHLVIAGSRDSQVIRDILV